MVFDGVALHRSAGITSCSRGHVLARLGEILAGFVKVNVSFPETREKHVWKIGGVELVSSL